MRKASLSLSQILREDVAVESFNEVVLELGWPVRFKPGLSEFSSV